MLAIRGIYDGEQVKLLEKTPYKKKFKVVVTFIEEINDNEDKDIRNFSTQTEAFEFWNDEKEDIYQDYLIQKN